MVEENIDKKLKKTKKGIKEGWLWNEYDGDDFEESINKDIEFPINKESVFEKYKRINRNEINK